MIVAIETDRISIGHVAALLAGFVVGAVFWHFVGFWDFVSTLVYAPPQSALVQQAPVAPVENRAALSVSYANCASLILDRTSGLTSVGPCRSQIFGRVEYTGSSRGDLVAGKGSLSIPTR